MTMYWFVDLTWHDINFRVELCCTVKQERENKEAFENLVVEGRNVTAPSTILLFIRRVAKQRTKQI